MKDAFGAYQLSENSFLCILLSGIMQTGLVKYIESCGSGKRRLVCPGVVESFHNRHLKADLFIVSHFSIAYTIM